jgi:multiple sugar transport system substrate-binding protein
MKKLARTFSLVLALVMMVTMMAACGGSSSSTSTPAASSSAPAASSEAPKVEEVAIDFWTHYTDDITFTKKKVEDFNKEYAGKIKVNLKHITDDYNNVLLLALKNGDGPDIYADGVPLDQLIQQNYVAPIEDLMSNEMMERVKDKKMINNNWVDGHWYSLPFRGYNFRLAWNKDLFKAAGLDPESPPKSYDELIADAKKITEYGKTQNPQKYGFMLPTGEDWIWWIYGQQMGFKNGQSYYDYTTGTYKWEALKPVMELYLQMKKDGSLFPGGTTMKNDPARAQFSAGNVGMILAASWDIGVFNDQFPATCEWDVTSLPSNDGQLHGYSQFDAGSYLQINGASNDQEKKAAMAFFEYLLSENTLVEYFEGGYGVPVYDGIAEKASKVPDRPGFAGFADVSIDRMYPYETPVQVEGSGFGTVMNDIMNGAANVDEAIADLNKRYNEAVQKGVTDGDFKLEDYTNKDFTCLTPSGK